MLSLILMVIVGFFMGSIPTGYILVKRMKGIDIRTVGSGNLGATNVGRVLGRKWFFITLALDALKGYIPVFVSVHFFGSYNVAVMCGIAVLLGHMFSPFVNFKGGKGVASSLGIGLALSPMLMITAVIVFSIVLHFYRMISLSSIAAASFIVVVSYFLAFPFLVKAFFVLAGLLVIALHYKNIKRILDGTESKIGEKIDLNTGADTHSHETHSHHAHGHHEHHAHEHHEHHGHSNGDYKRLLVLIGEFFKRQLTFQEEDKAHKHGEHEGHEGHHESQYERNNRHDRELWDLIVATAKGIFKGTGSSSHSSHSSSSGEHECCGGHGGHGDSCCSDDCCCGEGLYWDSKYNNPFRGNQKRGRTHCKQLGYSSRYQHHRHYGHYGVHNIADMPKNIEEKPSTKSSAKQAVKPTAESGEKVDSKKSTKGKKSDK